MDTKAQRCEVICLKPHSKALTEAGFDSCVLSFQTLQPTVWAPDLVYKPPCSLDIPVHSRTIATTHQLHS